MALIVEYHVVADMYPVGAAAISAGNLVELTNDLVIAVDAIAATNCLGVAGDSALNAEGQTTAYSDQVTIGANGAGTRWTENRVSDFYDETTASQKITVYNGGGKFWISSDLLDTGSATPVAGNLFGSGTTGGNGSWLVQGAVVGQNIAMSVGGVQGYDSGVPGTDTTNGSGGSMTLGDYFPVVLRI
jgi:hypothetical protein